MSTNKAAILKAVGPKNEAQATKLLADLDMSLGEDPSNFLLLFVAGWFFVPCIQQQCPNVFLNTAALVLLLLLWCILFSIVLQLLETWPMFRCPRCR